MIKRDKSLTLSSTGGQNLTLPGLPSRVVPMASILICSQRFSKVDGMLILQAQTWKRLAAEFPGRVVVQEHLADDRKIMSLDCMTGSIGVYLDGVCGPSHPIDENEMRRLIQEALAKKTADNKGIQPAS